MTLAHLHGPHRRAAPDSPRRQPSGVAVRAQQHGPPAQRLVMPDRLMGPYRRAWLGHGVLLAEPKPLAQPGGHGAGHPRGVMDLPRILLLIAHGERAQGIGAVTRKVMVGVVIPVLARFIPGAPVGPE